VARNVPTEVPNPVKEDKGIFIKFVPSPELGVPSAPPLYKTVPPVPKATLELSVPVKVKVLLIVRVLRLAIVNVAELAGSVSATLEINGTPVVVVFLRTPVARLPKLTPLIAVTVAAAAPGPEAETSPVNDVIPLFEPEVPEEPYPAIMVWEKEGRVKKRKIPRSLILAILSQ
jgi:hypothetical protein